MVVLAGYVTPGFKCLLVGRPTTGLPSFFIAKPTSGVSAQAQTINSTFKRPTPNLVPRACVTLTQRNGQLTLWKNPKPEPENPGSGLIAPARGFRTKWRLLIYQCVQQDQFRKSAGATPR